MRNLKGMAILAVMGVILAISSVQVGAQPESRGTPLPASWDEYSWEVEHRVQPGEFLYMLAGFYYRDGRKWNWIFEQNAHKLANPNLIRPGQVLTIRVPRGWAPPMSYRLYYDRTREQYTDYGTGTGAGPGYNEGPEGYVNDEGRERITPATPANRVRDKVGAK